MDEALSLRLPPGVRIQAYADDLVLTKTGQIGNTIQRDLQNACSILVKWGQSVKLEFASAKSELIIFSRKRAKLDLLININGTQILPSPTVKYLGVVLDEKLSWKAHVEQKCRATTRAIMDLRRFSKLTWGPSKHILERIYLSIAEPMLLYAAPI